MPPFVFSTNSHGNLHSDLLPFFAILAALILWVTPAKLAVAAPPAPPRPINLVILPCNDVIKTYNAAQPLATYLQNELGRQVNLIVPNSFAELSRLIGNRETDFVFQSPHVYTQLAQYYDRQHLLKALTPQGTSTNHGVFITRRGSGIKRLEDLRNRKVLFGMPFSTAKWMAAKSLLQSKGIDIDKDLAGYNHVGRCEAIALGVFLGQGDAGVICDYSFAELNENPHPRADEVPPGGLVAIGSTRELPTWVFAALKEVAPATVAAVTATLAKLDRKNPAHAKILAALETGGFNAARDADYANLREPAESHRTLR